MMAYRFLMLAEIIIKYEGGCRQKQMDAAAALRHLL